MQDTENIEENKKNLCANLATAAQSAQSNILEFEEIKIINSKDVNITMLNASDQEVVVEYENFMHDIQKRMNDSGITSNNAYTGSNASNTTNENINKTDISSANTLKTDTTTDLAATTSTSSSNVMIILIIAACVVGVFFLMNQGGGGGGGMSYGTGSGMGSDSTFIGGYRNRYSCIRPRALY
jgi:hypothetical protein